MRVEILNWTDGLREGRQAWCDLLDRGSINPSLHPDWLGFTLNSWGQTGSASIAIVRDGAGVRAVIPYLIRRRSIMGIPCRSLELCSNIFSYHAGIVGEDLENSLRALLAERRLPGWDVFRAVNVVADGPTARALEALARDPGFEFSVDAGESSPYVVVEHDWESYLRTRPKKLRANITRSERLMRDAGESGMTWYLRDADVRRLLVDMLDIEARSWKAQAGVSIVPGTAQHTYYERLLPWLAAHGLMANVLYVKDRPAAYALCACWNGWVGQLKTSHILELGDAGSRVINTSLQRAFQDGHREYDFLGDAAPHKMRWTERLRRHAEYWLFARNLRGRTLAKAKTLGSRWRKWRDSGDSHSTKDARSEVGEAT